VKLQREEGKRGKTCPSAQKKEKEKKEKIVDERRQATPGP